MSHHLSDLPLAVSVVIPAYNVAGTVAQTLESVFAQTYPVQEVIVVDDGSTDDTWQVLTSFGDRIRAVRQENGGLARARATGVSLANGDLIVLMDADDLCVPERIAVQAAFLQAHPEVILCCSEFDTFDGNGPATRAFSTRYYSKIGETPGGIASLLTRHATLKIRNIGTVHDEAISISAYFGDAYEEIVTGNFIHPPTVMFRREALEKAGNFDPDAGWMSDWDWFIRVARIGAVGFIDRTLLHYRLSPTQMTAPRNRYPNQRDILRVLERTFHHDPRLYQRHSKRYAKILGQQCLAIADILADEQGGQALRMLARSVVRHGVFEAQSLRVLCKALIPTAVIRGLREARKQGRSDTLHASEQLRSG
jgi:glycosyltransferase involved in cell wall biosynthesis